MGALFWLSDDQLSAVEPHLPKNQAGARSVDDQRVISGIFQVLKIGCRGRTAQVTTAPPQRSATASIAGPVSGSG
jgi:transposase